MPDPTPEPQADPAAVAAEIIADANTVLHKPAGGESAGAGADLGGLVDAYGRAADPALHLRRRNGTFATRNGKLICLVRPGSEIKRVEGAPAQQAANLDAEQEPSREEGSTEELPEADPQVSPLDVQAGAEFVTDLTEAFGFALAGQAGAATPDEKASRQRRWARWMEANNISVPFVLFGQAVMGEAKYLARVSVTAESQTTTPYQRLRAWMRKLRGKPPETQQPNQPASGPTQAPTPGPRPAQQQNAVPMTPDQLANF